MASSASSDLSLYIQAYPPHPSLSPPFSVAPPFFLP
nr:MAG TPA: hypothetical protein [Caudoviricetes sp.]